ncbi:hypothetical protein EVAR_12213_1 [Eumeta japonica]|uniref:Uncharacterized protein n=1 Tax=Eumeta variegata TaxID=151549 RepID=A0A4C1UGY1_EUMVA|nr:hypothetical protein EVAR_12213_1 [Eumeta japonica]
MLLVRINGGSQLCQPDPWPCELQRYVVAGAKSTATHEVLQHQRRHQWVSSFLENNRISHSGDNGLMEREEVTGTLTHCTRCNSRICNFMPLFEMHQNWSPTTIERGCPV